MFGEFFGGCSPAEDPACGDPSSGSVQGASQGLECDPGLGADCAPAGSGDLSAIPGDGETPTVDPLDLITAPFGTIVNRITESPDGSTHEEVFNEDGRLIREVFTNSDGVATEINYGPEGVDVGLEQASGQSTTIDVAPDIPLTVPETFDSIGRFGNWSVSGDLLETGGVGGFSGVNDGRVIDFGAFDIGFDTFFTESAESVATSQQIQDLTLSDIPELGIEFSRRLNELSFFQIYGMDSDVRNAMIEQAGVDLDLNPDQGGAVAAASSVEDLANNAVVQNVILGSISGNQVSAVMTPEQVIALAQGAGVVDDPGSVEPDVLRDLVAGGMWDGLDERQRRETFPLLSLDLVPQGQLDQTGLSGAQVAEIVTEIVALNLTSPDPVDLGGATRLINEDDLQGTSLWQHGQPILSTADPAHIVEFDPGVAGALAAVVPPNQLTQETWNAVFVTTNSDRLGAVPFANMTSLDTIIGQGISLDNPSGSFTVTGSGGAGQGQGIPVDAFRNAFVFDSVVSGGGSGRGIILDTETETFSVTESDVGFQAEAVGDLDSDDAFSEFGVTEDDTSGEIVLSPEFIPTDNPELE